jgi:hypothetical protein
MEEIRREIVEIDRDSDALEADLPRLRVEVQALRGFGNEAVMKKHREEELTKQEHELSALKTRREELVVAHNACARYRTRLKDGYVEPPDAHIRHRVKPVSPEYFRASRLAELWAAASTGLLLILAAGLIAAGVHELSAVAIVIVGAVLVDSILQGTVIRLLLNVTIILALITAGVLVREFFWQLSLLTIAAIGVVILVQNVRELRAH